MKEAEILDVEEIDGGIVLDLEYKTDEADAGPDVIGVSLYNILVAIGRKRASAVMLKLLWLLSVATRRRK